MSEIRIVVRAQDGTEQVFSGVVDRMEGLKRSAEASGGSFESFSNSVASAGSQMQRAMGVMTRLDLVQISLKMGAEQVAMAQAKYSEALAKHGAQSVEARNAAYALERAQDSLEKANLRARMSYALVTMEVVSMAGQLPRLLDQVSKFRQSITQAEGGVTGFLGKMNPGAMAAVAAGLMLWAGHAQRTQKELLAAADAAERVALAVGAATSDDFAKARQGVEVWRQEREEQRSLQAVLESGDREALENHLGILTAKKQAAEDYYSWEQEAIQRAAEEKHAQDLENLNRFREEQQRRGASFWGDPEDLQMGGASRTAALAEEHERLKTSVKESGDALRIFGITLVDDLNKASDATRQLEDDIESINEAIARVEGAYLAGKLKDGLGSIGVNLDKFSHDWQVAFLSASGASEEYTKTLKPAVDMSQALGLVSEDIRLAILNQANITAYAGETTAEFRQRLLDLGLTSSEINNRLDETGLRLLSVADATKQTAAAVIGAIPGFHQLSAAIQTSILAANGLDASFSPAVKDAAAFDQQLTLASGETRDALLRQAAAVKDKSGEYPILNRLVAEGKITEEEGTRAIKAHEEALKGQTRALDGAASAQARLDAIRGHSTGSSPPTMTGAGASVGVASAGSAVGSGDFGYAQGVALSRLSRDAYGNLGFADARGNTNWGAISLMNTRPDVDSTGVKAGSYAPFGQGFQNVGGLGATDIEGVYGSRTLIHNGRGGMSHDAATAQGGGDVYMGGVVVYAQGNAQEIAQGVEMGLRSTSRRIASRRNW